MDQQANDLALLPAGLFDVIAPAAAHEAQVVATLMAAFTAHGYERVEPPLMEFESTLCDGAAGDALFVNERVACDGVSLRLAGVMVRKRAEEARALVDA